MFDIYSNKSIQAAPGLSDKVLVIVTDDEWDFTNLKLCPEITTSAMKLKVDEKKEAIVKFAQSKFSEIYTCIVLDRGSSNRISSIQGNELLNKIYSFY